MLTEPFNLPDSDFTDIFFVELKKLHYCSLFKTHLIKFEKTGLRRFVDWTFGL
jgi:hypothetical protein